MSGKTRAKSWFFVAFLATLMVITLSLTPLVFAAERAWISTDGTMAFSNGAWVAVGGVRLVQGNLEVVADKLRYEVEAGKIDFVGNVHVTELGGSLTAEAFSYDVYQAKGHVTDGLAFFDIEQFDGPLYVLGDEITFEEGEAHVENARITTCEPPREAGYYLVSKRMDIFPGDRIVIRSVRFIESGMTLFYWPYLSIPIDGRRESKIEFPEIGHNPTDGWYIKTRFGYEGPGEGWGEIAVDVMERRGIGTGVYHVYRDRPNSQGSFTVYQRKGWNETQREWRLGWDETFSIGRNLYTTWRSGFRSVPVGNGKYHREGHGSLTLSHSVGSSFSRLDWDRRQYWDVNPGRIDRFKLNHRSRPLDWQWRLQVDGMSRHRVGYTDRDVFGYSSSLNRTFGPYSIRLDMENRVHSGWLSGSSSNPAWKNRTRLPEATFGIDIARLTPMRLPLNLEFTYGRLGEVRRVLGQYEDFRADRAIVNLTLKSTSINLRKFGRIQSRGGLAWYAYSTGERRFVLNANHQYRLSLTNRLSLFTNYDYRQTLGDDSPFQFDTSTYHERITGRLQYAHRYGNVVVSSGYDFAHGRISDVVGQLTFRSGTEFFGSVQTAYSPTFNTMTYASASVTLRPRDGVEVRASTRYDIPGQRLDSLRGSVAYSFPGWRLFYEGQYDAIRGWRRGDVAIVRDLNCREIGIRLDSLEGAVWLEYRINAMPGEGIRLGASQDRFLFDPESITSLF